MASTFTINSKSYDGRYLKVTCTQTPNKTAKKSTIYWEIESVGGNSNYYYTGPTTLTINGVQAYYKARTGAHVFPCAKGAVSGTMEIEHTRADGKLSIQVSISTAIYTATVSTNTGTWELDPIPNFVRIAYHPNGGTVGNTERYSVNSSGYIYDNLKSTAWPHQIDYGVSDDVHNASSFGLTRTGYKFIGWKILIDGQVIDQTTQYASTIFTDTQDPTKNTSNATDVRCRLQAQWQPLNGKINIDVSVSLIDSTNSGWGMWLQNYCKAKLKASATTQYGTIKSYKWSTGETTREITTNALTEAGTYGWSVTVTNDLGQSETEYVTVEVLPVGGDLYIPMLDNGTSWEVLTPVYGDGEEWGVLLPVIDTSDPSVSTTAVLGDAILGVMILGSEE